MLEQATWPAVTIVGHVCIDHNTIEGEYRESWGSAVLYISEYLRKNHGNTPRIIAPYASDLTHFIRTDNFVNQPSDGKTLVYSNIVKNGHREQFTSTDSVIDPVAINDDIIKVLKSTDILIVAPLLPNISPQYIHEIHKYISSDALTVLLPQGYYRKINKGEPVKVQRFIYADEILPHVDLLIQSDEDSSNAFTTAREWTSKFTNLTIIVSQNSHGASAFIRDNESHMPAKTARLGEIVNPVGAGDVLSAELAYSFKQLGLKDALKHAQKAAYDHITGNKYYFP
jgi:sugar/nucleoside kinase (ribokinase family)